MLRKKYKILEGIYFERLKYTRSEDNTLYVCECECVFCDSNFYHRHCENIIVTHKQKLLDLCLKTSVDEEYITTTPVYSYIPSRKLYRMTGTVRKKIERIL